MARRTASPRRDEVLAAAERLLVGEGPTALSMRRLAADLGTSYQVVYSRIGDKASVARALHDEGFRRLVVTAAKATAALDAGTDAHLLALARAYFEAATATPAMFDVMFGVPIPELVRDEAAREIEWKAFEATWVTACRAWLDARLERRPRGASVRLAWRLWTAVHGITVLHLAGHPSPSGDVPREIDRVVALLLADPRASEPLGAEEA